MEMIDLNEEQVEDIETRLSLFDENYITYKMDGCIQIGIEDNSNLPFHCLWTQYYPIVATACIAFFYQTSQMLVNLLCIDASYYQKLRHYDQNFLCCFLRNFTL